MRHGLQLTGICHLWLDGLSIVWDCLVSHCILGSRDRWEFQPFFRNQRQSLCTSLTADKCLLLRLGKGTAKKSIQIIRHERKHIPQFHDLKYDSGRSIGPIHYSDVIMSTMTSQITSLTVVHSIVYSDADQRKHRSSASLAFVRGIHRWPVTSPHTGLVTRKMFPFHDVIMIYTRIAHYWRCMRVTFFATTHITIPIDL